MLEVGIEIDFCCLLSLSDNNFELQDPQRLLYMCTYSCINAANLPALPSKTGGDILLITRETMMRWGTIVFDMDEPLTTRVV